MFDEFNEAFVEVILSHKEVICGAWSRPLSINMGGLRFNLSHV
jgi:hypothetical protein